MVKYGIASAIFSLLHPSMNWIVVIKILYLILFLYYNTMENDLECRLLYEEFSRLCSG